MVKAGPIDLSGIPAKSFAIQDIEKAIDEAAMLQGLESVVLTL